MKNLTKYLAIFCCSVLLGVSMIALFPGKSEADEIPDCPSEKGVILEMLSGSMRKDDFREIIEFNRQSAKRTN